MKAISWLVEFHKDYGEFVRLLTKPNTLKSLKILLMEVPLRTTTEQNYGLGTFLKIESYTQLLGLFLIPNLNPIPMLERKIFLFVFWGTRVSSPLPSYSTQVAQGVVSFWSIPSMIYRNSELVPRFLKWFDEITCNV